MTPKKRTKVFPSRSICRHSLWIVVSTWSLVAQIHTERPSLARRLRGSTRRPERTRRQHRTGRTWIGRVVRVVDGDTIRVMHRGKKKMVRLYGIDCPERDQPFGNRARQFMHKRLKDRFVRIRTVARDRFRRLVAWVHVAPFSNSKQKRSSRSLNAALLRAGLAWQDRRYDRSPHFRHLERRARHAKRGLWHDPKPIPPWRWRRIWWWR